MKYISLVITLFLGFTLLVSANNPNEKSTVLIKTDVKGDASPHVLKEVLLAKENGITEIKFEKGVYHFYPEKALEMFCYISNHEDVVTRTAFPLIDFENITIDGQGSEFIFHGLMIPFIIEGGKNITVKNLSVDWKNPFHSEGTVVANDPKAKTVDIEYSSDYPYEIRNGQVHFVHPYYEHTIGQCIFFDPKREAILYKNESYLPVELNSKTAKQFNIDKLSYKYENDPRTPFHSRLGFESKMNAKEIKPGVIRFSKIKKEVPPVGAVLVSKGKKGDNRIAPAFRVTGTYDLNIQSVTVHHAGGMGLICENSENITLDGFNTIPAKGRVLSASADATHFVGCRGKVELKNCELRCQMDDALNVHGTYQKVMDIIDEHTIGIHVGHFEQQMFSIGRPNDTIGLVRLSDSFFPYNKLTLKSIQKLNGRYHLVTFNEKLPANIKAGDLIENLDAYPEVTVRDCEINGNRARGLLISTPRKTLVTNNFFHTHMSAILVPVESGFWYESGSASNLVITNNVFQDCVHGSKGKAVIQLETDDDNENIAFKDITISNNTFNQYDNLILEVKNTDGFTFEGNTITNSRTFPQLHSDRPAIIVESSINVVFKKNSYKGNAKEILHTDGKSGKLKFK
ncbi:alpha-1,3-galactosidase-related protein [Saccharicrinis aurantiacus]|uniref:alpha-1,3-galactosidase-related protein n=1 Tax=Saccharicrinis aurantiacus TaxID=1849719 RepID=UPI0024932FAC|nr:right-handed parallel beta-helix repeat-containing protein [Saccharicrinis aurantiacus]